MAGSQTTDEVDALIEFLNYQRETLLKKAAGLSEDQARATPTASSLSIIGLLQHSAIWEQRWFQYIVVGEASLDGWPDSTSTARTSKDTFVVDAAQSLESVSAAYRQQVARSDEILRAAILSDPVARANVVDESIRWVALHMIEETARHAGHADIIRETIDGSVGH